MEAFIKIVDEINIRVNAIDKLCSKPICSNWDNCCRLTSEQIVENGGFQEKWNRENTSNENKIQELTESLILFISNSTTDSAFLDLFLKNSCTFDRININYIGRIKEFIFGQPLHQHARTSTSNNLWERPRYNEQTTIKSAPLYALSYYMLAYLRCINYIAYNQHEICGKIHYNSSFTHNGNMEKYMDFAIITSDNYYTNQQQINTLKNKLIATTDTCNRLTTELIDINKKYNKINNELITLKNRIANVIPEQVIYDYEDIGSRIQSFKDELLMTQRIFARIIKHRMNIPIAQIVAKYFFLLIKLIILLRPRKNARP